MDYQVLVLDLDGTLTNSKKEVTPETKEALIDIQEMGKKVVLASGRPTKGVLPLAEQLRLSDYGSYILSFNGARITDCRSRQIMYNRLLPRDAALPAFRPRPFPGRGRTSSPTQTTTSSPGYSPTAIPCWSPGSTTCLSLRAGISQQISPMRSINSLPPGSRRSSAG